MKRQTLRGLFLATLISIALSAVGAAHWLVAPADNAKTSGTRPTCAAAVRNQMWFAEGAAGANDSVQVCQKDSSDVYNWMTLATGSGGTTAANAALVVDSNKSVDTLAARSSLILGGTGVAGSAGSEVVFSKSVGSIANNTATSVLTVTVPNAAQSVTIPLVLSASLGTGGAIGANECSATAYGQIVLTRTPGVATVATATTLSNTGSACVAGATTMTLAYSVTAMTGAVGVTQTFDVQVTIARGGGSSANHTIVLSADVINANASGVTIS